MQKFTVKTIVAIGIGAAIYFLLARFVSIPIFANTYLSFQYAVLGFFAAVFGPIAGLLIAFIGHALADFTGYGLWWSWIITSAVVGCVSGLLMKGVNIDEGVFGKKDIVRFALGNLIIHLVAWVGIAAPLDILIYSEPSDKVFTQGLLAGASNGVLTAVIGTLLLLAYARTRTKSGSLDKD
jgi:energy-coupling factor transport system substrate-specific component